MSAPVTEKGYASRATAWWAAESDEDTPELVGSKAVEVYDRMRRQDAQVMSVLRAVALPIRRTSWRVAAGNASPQVAAFVADELGLPLAGQNETAPDRTRDRFSWAEHLRLALLMLPFGHSFFEQVYRPDGRVLHLRKLGWRPPRTISGIDVAADGGLQAVRQWGVSGGAAEVKIPVDRLVAYVNEREGGNWKGQSLLRPAYKFWLLKDRALRTQAQVIDRNGLGVPIYTAREQPADVMDTAERIRRETAEMAEGAKMAQAYRSGQNAGGAVPPGAKLDLQGVSGTLPNADPVIRYYDEQIARTVLANFLNLGGDNSTGSYALGETFADFFVQSLQTIALQIADTASQHIVEDLVDLNFGPDAPAPQITFDEIGSRHPTTAAGIQQLITCGALTPDEPLEHFLRTTLGLPAADPATARELPKAATTPTPGAAA